MHVFSLNFHRISFAVHVFSLKFQRNPFAAHVFSLSFRRIAFAAHVFSLNFQRNSFAVHVFSLSFRRNFLATHVFSLNFQRDSSYLPAPHVFSCAPLSLSLPLLSARATAETTCIHRLCSSFRYQACCVGGVLVAFRRMFVGFSSA